MKGTLLVPKHRKLRKKLGRDIDPNLMRIMLEIVQKYLDSGGEVTIDRLARSLRIPPEYAFELCKRLRKLGFIFSKNIPQRVIPSQSAYSFLSELAQHFDRVPGVSLKAYRQSKAYLGKAIDTSLLKKAFQAIEEPRWKRVRIDFHNLGLIVYVYESGTIDFKGRNTNRFHERIALLQLSTILGRGLRNASIDTYRWSVTVDLQKYRGLDLEELDSMLESFIQDIHDIYNLWVYYEPEQAPCAVVKIGFHDFKEICTILIWSTGKFMVSAGSPSLIERGMSFMLDYAQTHFIPLEN